MQKQVEYDQAIIKKYPEQVVIAVSKDADGKPNSVTVGWTMIVSGNPPMMAIALAAKHYSTKAIRHSKAFTIAFPSEEMADDTLFFGSVSGRDTDKFARTECKTQPAEKIDSLLLSESVANFECELDSETIAGDHVIFIGNVIASHINTEPKKRLYTIGPGHKLGSVT